MLELAVYRSTLIASLSLVLLFVEPVLAQNNGIGEDCPVLGAKRTKQFMTARKVRCFDRKRQAIRAGFTAITSTGIGWSVSMTGEAEVPPVDTDSSGNCNVVLSSNQETLTIVCALVIESAIASHLHQGAVGESGQVICPLSVNDSHIAATCTLTPEQVSLLRSGQTYINVHTSMHPNGEIRGQIG